MEYFWTTSNSNKTEVSTLLLKIPGLRRVGKLLMRSLSDVSIHQSLALTEDGH